MANDLEKFDMFKFGQLVNKVETLQSKVDDKGDYLKEWNHPTLPRPTDKELA